ncbi:retrotransposon-like protein 1 [Entomophthora muscae]|uniref:Retrotransposon-like protein 1 n=1 Tax=Entomophthora muscae TaxID=34485 RepID=A0ACC2S484_9FUNG|nr:retrotransposon-like protein 1 [Entomophthora muscae]
MGLTQAHFTAYRFEFSTNSHKVLYLSEKLTSHYRDWFSSHSIHNPGILQNYDLFVSSLLSFSGEDKELSNLSASQFAGLTQGSLPLGKYNQKFCSLQSRLQASDAEACSFYKIGLNRLLQEFLVHHNLPNELEPLIREVVKWNQRYLSSKKHPHSNLFPAARLFVTDKPLHPVPSQRLEEIFASLLRKFSEEGTITSDPTMDQRTIFYQPSLSPSVFPNYYGPLGKIKVLALLDTGANVDFIEEKLANLIGLPAFGSLDVKMGNSTLTGATPILQPVAIDLDGSPFYVMYNSSPNLSFPFILGFPWLRESLLNFDHPSNKILFTCNDVVK